MLLAAITSLTGWRKKTPPPLIEYLDQTITFPLHNSRLQILSLVERNRSSRAWSGAHWHKAISSNKLIAISMIGSRKKI
jgi:hypothetical protein